MKLIVCVALAVLAVAAAAPATPVQGEPVKILRSEFNQEPEGGYQFSFETDDGTSRQETGEVKSAVDEENKPHDVVVVRGSYSYTNKEGVAENVQYYADETGFHAEGPSIPK